MIRSKAPASQILNSRSLTIAALILSLSAAVGIGFGRFAYALLLEPMRSSLNWSYAQAGLINSANAIGYLIGTATVGLAVSRFGSPTTVRTGTLAAALAIIATGLTDNFALLMMARIIAGLGAGLIYVGGAALILRHPEGNPTILGLYYAGPGIGIALSGIGVPSLLGTLNWDWPAIWIAMGLCGLLVMLAVEPIFRRFPHNLTAATSTANAPHGAFDLRDYREVWPIFLAFGLYGIGYIGYMTFIIAFFQADGADSAAISLFWGALGVCAALGGFIWGPILSRRSPPEAGAMIMSALAFAALIPAIWPNPFTFAISALLFGGSFLSVVTAVTGQVRRRIPQERWATVMGHAVTCFAIGQLIGPTLTGFVADLPSGLALGMAFSAALLSLAGMIASYDVG